MADPTTSSEIQPGSGVAPPVDPGASAARKTNVVVIAGAILAFVVVAGLVAAAVFVFVFADDGPELVVDPVTQPAADAPSAEPGVGDSAEPPKVALSSVFTFRDVFDPLIKPLPEEVEPTTPGTTPTTPDGTDGTGDTTYPQDMLVLLDIVTEGDGYAGVFSWNGSTHTLSPGERIPDSPWQLVSATPTEVVMLYGDVRVTLTIGSRVVK